MMFTKALIIWKFNNMLLNNPWVKKVMREIRKYLKWNIMKIQHINIWDITKVVIEEKFKALYLKEEK